MDEILQPRWKKAEYSRNQIIKAGKKVRNPETNEEEVNTSITIIDNWRASHAYPLHVFYMYLRRMSNNSKSIIVAERLKRLDSIIAKLKREPTMSLWSMQDLGGCRFIVSTVDEVYMYSKKMEQSSIRHKHISTYDYIKNPKISGYRSLHLVYQYYSDKVETYNKNMLIEIQFRTYLQHIWATALETMGLFTKQALKAGEGNKDINRFFSLISSLFAIEEENEIIPGTTHIKEELVSEIEEINSRCRYIDILSAIKVAINHQDSHMVKNGYSILILNYETHMLRIKSYMPSQNEKANNEYKEIEKRVQNENIDAVLVRVSSFQMLKAAYPNYFSDISNFIERVKNYLK